MTSGAVPPSPRLMALRFLCDLPGAPEFGDLADETLGELVLLGLSGNRSSPIAQVAVHVTTPSASLKWLTQMDLEAFIECMPSWPLLNAPSSPSDCVAPRPQRRRSRVQRSSTSSGHYLATAWRGNGRPVRTTDALLLSAIELIPDDAATQYLDAIRRLRARKFDAASRTLIAEMCELVSAIRELPKAS